MTITELGAWVFSQGRDIEVETAVDKASIRQSNCVPFFSNYGKYLPTNYVAKCNS